MENKIIFCNIAWMKNYEGVTEEDKPFNGGKYIAEVGSGGEVYNFLDDNGKCYGAVNIGGNMALQNHFKGVTYKNKYVDDILVVWVATNEKKQTRIVGWYKNARAYRTYIEAMYFIDQSPNKYYNIEAKAKDCYLLPVEDRSFPIDRASEVGTGMGIGQSNIWYAESSFARSNIVPKVIQYIEGYDGKYSNFVYDISKIDKEIKDLEFSNDFEKLYKQGLKKYNDGYNYEAIVYFKAARKIKEPSELLIKLAEALYCIFRNNDAIELLNRVIRLEGESIDVLISLMYYHDSNVDQDKTIEYAKKIIEFTDNSYDEIENKRFAYCVIFDIYIYENEFKKAKEIMNNLKEYLKNIANYSKEDMDNIINEMKDIIKEALEIQQKIIK